MIASKTKKKKKEGALDFLGLSMGFDMGKYGSYVTLHNTKYVMLLL